MDATVAIDECAGAAHAGGMPFDLSDAVEPLRREFAGARGYLAACIAGLVTAGTADAVAADLRSRPDPVRYGRAVEATRAHFARLVGVSAGDVAIASQTSVAMSLLAAALPDGAEVLVPVDEFSSLVMPFALSGRSLVLRTAPLAGLADAVGPATRLVAFSLVQSATGEVADADAIRAAAASHGASTVCDVTQAAGWHPVDASGFDAVVCHAYKWLCCPRGVAFLALRPEFAARLRPVQAGWYAGVDPWSSCYGGEVRLAEDARRFDVSPAWQAFVGAEPAMRAFADADPGALHAHATGLADRFAERIGLDRPRRPSAIVTWPDPDGAGLAALAAAGVVASGRNGRARVGFHVFNDDRDVDLAVEALRP